MGWKSSWATAVAAAAMMPVMVPGSARAQAQPSAAAPAPYALPPAYPPPAYPPAAQAPDYGYAPLPRPQPSPQQFALYQDNKKNPGVALLLELFIPGVGSIYADHAVGAAVTWALQIGGLLVAVWGIGQLRDPEAPESVMRRPNNDAAVSAIVAGFAIAVGGRIYGLVDSWSSASDYNSALAAQLGIADASFIIAPMRAGNGLAWGPALSLRF